MSYSRDDIIRIANNMQYYGGRFAYYLGKALIHADSDNLARLEKAFPELLEKYSQFPSD